MDERSAKTRERILTAAVSEFAAFGLAGARVDRIAERSASNKRMIYVYFGNKEGLFTASLHHVMSDTMNEVPFTAEDLPGWAGAMFDHLMAQPEALRLMMWRQLERPDAGPDSPDTYAVSIHELCSPNGQAHWLPNEHASGLPPVDLLVLVQGMAVAWMISPTALLAADGADPTSSTRHSIHRRALVEAVRRISAPPDDGPVRAADTKPGIAASLGGEG